MNKWFDKSLFKDMIRKNPVYIFIYTGLLILLFIYINMKYTDYEFSINFYSLLPNCVWLLFIFVFLVKQHYHILRIENNKIISKNNEIIQENDELDLIETNEPVNRLSVFNTFVSSLYIKILLPFIASFFIDIIFITIINKFIIKDINPITYPFTHLFPIFFYNAIAIIVITALAVLLWANFKTVIRAILFTIILSLSSIWLLVNIFSKSKEYLKGFYNPYNFYTNILDAIYGGRIVSYHSQIIALLILIAIFLLVIGQRNYIKKTGKQPSEFIAYCVLFLFLGSFAFLTYSPFFDSELYITIICLFIVYLIFGFLISLALYCKSFKFLRFLKQILVVFIITSAVCIALRYDIFGFKYHIPESKNIKQIELKIHDYTGDYIQRQEGVEQILSSFDKKFVFKSKEAYNALKEIHKSIIKMDKVYDLDSEEDEIPLMIFDFNYKIKPLFDMKREYIINYDYLENPSLVLPLIKTSEFKQCYFELLYKNENCSLVFISNLKEKEKYNGIIKDDNNISNGLRTAMKIDVEKFGLDYIVNKDTNYKYYVQIVYNISSSGQLLEHSLYYIPNFYTNTISYIEKNNDKIFKEPVK